MEEMGVQRERRKGREEDTIVEERNINLRKDIWNNKVAWRFYIPNEIRFELDEDTYVLYLQL